MHRGDDTSVSALVRNTLAARVKHALDRVLAAIALIVFSPLLGVIAVWILVETGRPVLFAHARVGKNGRVFRMVKFRTMVQDAIAIGQALHISEDPYGHLPDDPRITRSGRFLRRTSLDELPQLFNVVRGEMSLVGPRADIVEQVENYTESDRRRLAVKPGITGWAQVNGRDSIPWPERFELDAWYIQHWSLALDAKIVLRTARALIGARPEPIVDEMNIERAKARRS
jgi:lipopolysaccharide/colanic/teichoic acid biosynthesis glycosyltransferase